MVPHECKYRIITAFSESKHRMTILLRNPTPRNMPQINKNVPQTHTLEFTTHYSSLLKGESNLQSLTDESKCKMWHAHQKEIYLNKKILAYATTWMIFKGITLSEIKAKQNDKELPLSTEENYRDRRRWEFIRAWGLRNRSYYLMNMGFLFEMMEILLK